LLFTTGTPRRDPTGRTSRIATVSPASTPRRSVRPPSKASCVARSIATPRCNKRGCYGGEVCGSFVGAREVGLEQVRSGHAWWSRECTREQAPEDRKRYAAAEAKARPVRRGLRRDAAPTPPWDSRRRSRGVEHARARAAGEGRS
jgi:hypothetical protein